jgi:hypothetical protein
VQPGHEFGRVHRVLIKEPPVSQPVQIRLTGSAEWAFRVDNGLPISTVQDLGLIIQFAAEILSNMSPKSSTRSI